MAERTVVEMPVLDFRAEVSGVDDQARTVEVKWSTGAGVLRTDWSSGQNYLEVLSLDAKHVRLDRLNGGAPLLNSHESDSLSRILGVVVEGSARIAGPTDARARLRFSRRADVEPFYQDVRDGIIKNVSVGYRVHKFEESKSNNGATVRTAIDWEPFEISLVPMGADAGARLRAATPLNTNACEIVACEALSPIAAAVDPADDRRGDDDAAAFNARLVEAFNRTPPSGFAWVVNLDDEDRVRLWEQIRETCVTEGDDVGARSMSDMIELSRSER